MMIGHGIQNAVEWKKQGFGTRGRSPGLESLCGCEGGDDNETCIFMTAMDACDSNLYSLIVFGAQIKQKGADTHTHSLSLSARDIRIHSVHSLSITVRKGRTGR